MNVRLYIQSDSNSVRSLSTIDGGIQAKIFAKSELRKRCLMIKKFKKLIDRILS